MRVESTNIPLESRSSLGSRISWGAVVGGAVIALSLQFLLTLLGAAAGLSLSNNVSGESMKNGALVYLALTMFASLFVGGVVTSLLTGGENKQEAFLSGLVMWGVAFVTVMFLGTAGIQGGANVLTSAANAKAQAAPTATWEDSARQAGVTDAQINDLKAKNNNIAAKVQDPANQEAARQAASKAMWYGFFITWISMAFAALGAYSGAGPTFRVVTFSNAGHKNASDERLPQGVVPAT
jgi:hypothetical protein